MSDQDAQLIYLRHHGKYLTPGRGIDLVSAIAVGLRGLLLNVLVWLPLTALALFILWLVPPVPFVHWEGRLAKGYGWATRAVQPVW